MWDALPSEINTLSDSRINPPSISIPAWDIQKRVNSAMTWYSYNREKNVLREDPTAPLQIKFSTGYGATIHMPGCGKWYYTISWQNQRAFIDSIFAIVSDCTGETINRSTLSTFRNGFLTTLSSVENPSINNSLDALISSIRTNPSIVARELLSTLERVRSHTDDSKIGRIVFGTPVYQYDDKWRWFLDQIRSQYSERELIEILYREFRKIYNPGKSVTIEGDTRTIDSSIRSILVQELSKYGITSTSPRYLIEPILSYIAGRFGVDIGFVSVGSEKWADGRMIVRLQDGNYALIWRDGLSFGGNIRTLLDRESITTGRIVVKHYLTNLRWDIIGVINTPLTEYVSGQVQRTEDYRAWLMNPRMIPEWVSIELTATNTQKWITLTNKVWRNWYIEYGLSEKDIYGLAITIHRITAGYTYDNNRFDAQISHASIATSVWSPGSHTLALSLWVKLLKFNIGWCDVTTGTRMNALWQKTDGNNKKHLDTVSVTLDSGGKIDCLLSDKSNIHVWAYRSYHWAPTGLFFEGSERDLKNFVPGNTLFAGAKSGAWSIDASRSIGFSEDTSSMRIGYTGDKIRFSLNGTNHRIIGILGGWQARTYGASIEYPFNPSMWIGMSWNRGNNLWIVQQNIGIHLRVSE
jgi:hypothetical protein